MTGGTPAPLDWLRAFLPLGSMRDGRWQSHGACVLLLDRPVAWLVTATAALRSIGDEHATVWVPSRGGTGLLDVTASQQQLDIGWIHHPAGISATLFPINDRFTVKAFTDAQCTRLRDLQPLQPCASLGCLYGADAVATPHASPAAHDGVIALVEAQTGFLFATAPLLPRNVGAPLLLASPYGGPVTLAGIVLDNTLLGEPDPRILPVRLSRAICVDAVLELIRGEAAQDQRRRATASHDQPNGPTPKASGGERAP